MFGSAYVVAQSLPLHGAFNHWWVLLWLALIAGCLLAIAGIVALVQLVGALVRERSRAHGRLRIPVSSDGTANP